MLFSLKLSAPAALLTTAIVAAGCGGSSGGQSSASSSGGSAGGGSAYGPSTSGSLTTASAHTAAARLTVTTAHNAKLGTYLVDGRRRAMYLFEKDKRGSGKSTCSGACASAWPPVIVKGTPRVAGGVNMHKVTTLRRANGSRQLVYNGWPIYYFAPDTRGTTKGQGVDAFGAEWYVLAPSGKKIDHGS